MGVGGRLDAQEAWESRCSPPPSLRLKKTMIFRKLEIKAWNRGFLEAQNLSCTLRMKDPKIGAEGPGAHTQYLGVLCQVRMGEGALSGAGMSWGTWRMQKLPEAPL